MTMLASTPGHQRGGVVVFNGAEAIDFEFLGLRPLDPSVEHLDNQAAEDALCQRLLLLGANDG